MGKTIWQKSAYRDIKILFTSGYTDDAVVNPGAVEADVALLFKPYTPANLVHKTRELLDAPSVKEGREAKAIQYRA